MPLDIDTAYDGALGVLLTEPCEEEEDVDAATEKEDNYRDYRTK